MRRWDTGHKVALLHREHWLSSDLWVEGERLEQTPPRGGRAGVGAGGAWEQGRGVPVRGSPKADRKPYPNSFHVVLNLC